MVTKKSNAKSVNWSDEAIHCLQILGFYDGNKKATSKNISEFASKMVIRYVHDSKFRVNLLKAEAKDKQKTVVKLNDNIMKLTKEIDILNKLEDELK